MCNEKLRLILEFLFFHVIVYFDYGYEKSLELRGNAVEGYEILFYIIPPSEIPSFSFKYFVLI